MSKSAEEQIGALAGAGDAEPSTDTVDWKKRYEELEKKFNSVRIEEGRVKKLDEELKSRDKEIAELRAMKEREALLSSLSEEDRASVAPEFLDITHKLVSKGMSDAEERMREQFKAQQESARREAAATSFLDQLDARYPWFRSSVTDGGPNASAWAAYRKRNAGTIREAFENGDFDTFAYHVEQFCKTHCEVPDPSGNRSGSAAPEPASNGGGNNGNGFASGKIYTQEEFLSLYDKVEEARSRGDYALMKKLNAEIQNAPAEGRVK